MILLAVVIAFGIYGNHEHPAAAAHGHGHRQQSAVLTTAHAGGGAAAVSFAVKQDGDAYVWGGNGPSANGGWDCSGLVTAAWAKAGVTIPRTSAAEWHGLRHVGVRHLHPGDLLFYPGSDGTWSDPGHVAMFTGHGRMVEAYSRLVGVRITSVRRGDLVGAARP